MCCGWTKVELDLLEPSQGLSLDVSIGFLLRITNLADIVIFSTPINLASLEKETGMAPGGILRQCLRLGTPSIWLSSLVLNALLLLLLIVLNAFLRVSSR
ncbi:unnamed protein product [Dibothriocephalus latus]|uniref:Uncharacterized protein n=1 Tax=Dibothriocephalus latus TaxID=60516 RepID=A0A3P7NHH4_DIBLA|nr:unnamed protein product [Dibothriocephalus latus]